MFLSGSVIVAAVLAGLAGASPSSRADQLTPTGFVTSGPIAWPETGTASSPARRGLTNAERIRRGLPLQQPKRLFNPMEVRAYPAPSAGTSGSKVYRFTGCNAGGDGYVAFYGISGTLQQMTDQCASFQAQTNTGSGIFAVWPEGNLCYTSVTYPPNYPVDCSSASAIIADYGPA